MRRTAAISFACVASSLVFASACPPLKTQPDAGNPGDDGGVSGPGATIAAQVKLARAGSGALGHRRSTNGSAVATGLQSLKYFVTQIQICQGLDTNGSAFSNPTHCISIYQGPSEAGLDAVEDPSHPAAALDYVRTHKDIAGYVDMMDATSRATLTSTVTVPADATGDYQWGIVTWHPEIKLTATITSPSDGSSLLYTHDGTNSTPVDLGGQAYTPTISSTSFATAPAEEAIGSSGNGGSWFRFEHPFTISASDITSGAQFSLDLAFDPDSLIQGVTAPGASNFPPLVDSASAPGGGDGSGASAGWNSIAIPALALTPVAHKASSHVVRETYVAHVTTPSSGQDLRLELYALDDDASKTIYSVNNAYIPNAATTGYIAGSPQIAFVADGAGDVDAGTPGPAGGATSGTITFEDTSHAPVIQNFTRGVNINDTTSALVPCGGGLLPDDAACTDGQLEVTYTLTNIDTL